MSLRLKKPTSEHDSISIIGFVRKKAKIWPKEIINEAESFYNRNSFSVLLSEINGKAIKDCCPRCLKAHLIKKVNELKLEESLIKDLSKAIDCETGHNGYYIDKRKLIECQEPPTKVGGVFGS